MSKEVSELPPEIKLDIAINSLWELMAQMLQMAQNTMWGLLLGSWAAWANDISWEKWVPSVQKFCRAAASQGTKDLIAAFKIPGNDCTTVAKAHQLVTDPMGFDNEIIEITPKKVFMVHKKCQLLDITDKILPKYRDLSVEEMPCFIFDETMGKTVNPKITFKIGESFCRGGKVCDHTWELKE